MKISIINTIAFCVLITLVSACKSNFEKLRTNSNPQIQLNAANDYYEQEDYLKAQTLYELVISSFRGRKESTELFYKYAYTHYHLEEYILAAYYFNSYADKFPSSPYREDALYMAAYSNYQMSPSYKLDQTYSQKAIEGFQLYANTYPNSDKISKINDLIDELRAKLQKKSFEAADLYYKMDDYQSAVRSFQHTLQDFPETNRAEEIRFKIIDAQSKLAIESVYEKKLERARKTLEYIQTFKTKYPDSEYTNKVTKIEKNIKDLINRLHNGGHKVTSTRTES